MAGLAEGKVTLVTGATSGIGRATALLFAKEGTKVVVDDINVEGGEETVRMIKDAGGEAFFFRGDVRVASDMEALVNKTVDTYGRLDCAFNNAGILGPLGFISDYTEEDWDNVMNTNLKGVWLCMKYEIPVMRRQRSGAIVNMASASAMVGLPLQPCYSASKGSLVQLTKAASLENCTANIRINVVLAGPTRTPLHLAHMGNDPNLAELRSLLVPMERIAEPEEIARTVVWLCSDGASFVTGHALVADGGWLAGQSLQQGMKLVAGAQALKGRQ